MSDDPEDPPEDEIEPLELEQTEDVGSPRAVRKRKVTAAVQQRDADRFWLGIFQSEIGRREMWKLLAAMHPFETKFACGPNGFPQPEATWHALGEQALGLRIYQTWAAKFPLETMAMLTEHDPRFAKRDK